jgi:hypothetical protein
MYNHAFVYLRMETESLAETLNFIKKIRQLSKSSESGLLQHESRVTEHNVASTVLACKERS